MNTLASLALSSLRARCFTVLLTVITIAFSVMLLLGVECIRQEARTSFVRSVAGVDLIVGARAHPVQLLLYSVFGLGDASNNLRSDSAQWVADRPEVAWMVPISLGDSHRGYRVVGTTQEYFNRISTRPGEPLRFSAGEPFPALFDAVLGAEVARKLSYRVGDEIVLAHGTTPVALQKHDDRPFRVSGVLAATGTAIDQGIYVSLPALEAIHLNWHTGARIGRTPDITQIPSERLRPQSMTALFIGLHSKVTTFTVQRAVNDYTREPLSAILPGVALQQLWGMLSTVERALTVAAACVVAAGFMVLITTIVATLHERRREMAILRAVGASARHVFGLLLLEAAVLATVGAASGLLLVEAGVYALGPWLQIRFGIFIDSVWLGGQALPMVAAVVVVGTVMGLVPAVLAYRYSVQDGMTIKT